MNKTIKRILCVLLTLSIGTISGIATSGSIDNWYTTLQKPSFNPPNYIFAPVWTILYILMGISLFLILESENNGARRKAIIVFGVQLFLNFCWSFLFFKYHLLAFASRLHNVPASAQRSALLLHDAGGTAHCVSRGGEARGPDARARRGGSLVPENVSGARRANGDAGKVCEKFHKPLAMSFQRMFNAPLTDEIRSCRRLARLRSEAFPMAVPFFKGAISFCQ